MLYQCVVVVVLALGNADLCQGCISLLLSLANAGLVFGGVYFGDHLSGVDRIAFTHMDLEQLTCDFGLDHGRGRGLYRARNGQAQGQVTNVGNEHIVLCQFNAGCCAGRGRAGQGSSFAFAQEARAANDQHGQGYSRQNPDAFVFHGFLTYESAQGRMPRSNKSAWCWMNVSGSIR